MAAARKSTTKPPKPTKPPLTLADITIAWEDHPRGTPTTPEDTEYTINGEALGLLLAYLARERPQRTSDPKPLDLSEHVLDRFGHGEFVARTIRCLGDAIALIGCYAESDRIPEAVEALGDMVQDLSARIQAAHTVVYTGTATAPARMATSAVVTVRAKGGA